MAVKEPGMGSAQPCSKVGAMVMVTIRVALFNVAIVENGDGDWWWSSMRRGQGDDFDFEYNEDPNIWKMSVHFSGFPNHLCLGYGCKEPWAARRGKFGWSCICHHLVSGWIESTCANLMSHFLMKCKNTFSFLNFLSFRLVSGWDGILLWNILCSR